MHELSVCLFLLDEVTLAVRRAGAVSVRSISVSIGPLSGVDAGLLARAFDVARLGGISNCAQLLISAAPVRVHCYKCDLESEVPPNRLLCTACGDHQTKVTQGSELTLLQIEMDVPDHVETHAKRLVAS
jgi:hydrogenase nickel incorporation protein HypA/HybF